VKTLFHTPAQAGLSIVLTIVSLVCFCSAIVIGNSRQTDRQNSSAVGTASSAADPLNTASRFENEEDREVSERLLGMGPGTVSPEAFAKARASALALPSSSFLQGRKFQGAQATAGNDSSSWSPLTPVPPIVDPFFYNNENSVRIVALGLHPVDPDVVYAGSYGGLLKSDNGGQTWDFLSDGWLSQAVNSIAIDPNPPGNSQSNTIYVGTGSIDLPRGYGVGLYRSTDAGANWTLFRGNCPPSSCGPNGVPRSYPKTRLT
jgi:hypothetical protein